MAIDSRQTQDLINGIEDLFNQLSTFTKLPQDKVAFVREVVMGEAFAELNALIGDSRPPVLFLFGRTRHGKSSLINRLANKEVAPVDDIEPTTPEATRYTIHFEGVFSTWDIIDSRGIFETTRAKGASEKTSTEQVKEDIDLYKPDVILHVIDASQIGGCEKDFEFFEEVCQIIKNSDGRLPPIFMVLTKADILGNPREWPPEDHARKSGKINDVLDYTSKKVLNSQVVSLDPTNPTLGASLTGGIYSAIIPVCALEGEAWNIDTVIDFIAMKLPKNAKLHFYQAVRRKDLLQKIADSIVWKFSLIAGGIGAGTVIPVSDVFILTPLQMLMVAIVGGLSCKPISMDTAREYFAALGVGGTTAIALRVLARQAVKLIPGFSMPVSALIAASGTYGIGKSAEAYFFRGEIKNPAESAKEYKAEEKSIAEW